jgi:UDP-N-acetylglucosamine 3-dehydrogenase
MRFISQQDPITVYAKMGSMKHRRFEDYAHIMLTYKNGESAFIESNWLTPYKTRTLTVTGSDAIMRLDYITQDMWIEQQKETLQPRYPFQEPLKCELQHFAECVIEKKKPLITGEDGVKALQIAEAAVLSSAKNRAVNLKR